MCLRNEIENLKRVSLYENTIIFYFSSSGERLQLDGYNIIDVSKDAHFKSYMNYSNPVSFVIDEKLAINYSKRLDPDSRYVYKNNNNYYDFIVNHLKK
jgi:hypothetical protein